MQFTTEQFALMATIYSAMGGDKSDPDFAIIGRVVDALPILMGTMTPRSITAKCDFADYLQAQA